MKPGRATVSCWLRKMMLKCGLGVSKGTGCSWKTKVDVVLVYVLPRYFVHFRYSLLLLDLQIHMEAV